MKYYLDTNALIFLLYERQDEFESWLLDELTDYSNVLLTSSVCVQEFIHLVQIRRLRLKRRGVSLNPDELIEIIEDAGITIVPANKLHLQTMSELPLPEEHHDPADRLIVAQAISDRTALVSSDHKFKFYEPYGLNFVFNKR